MPDPGSPPNPMPPPPKDGAAVRPDDGPQDVPQEPGSAVADPSTPTEEAADDDTR
ncbi:MAG TPA: hypothetical protein VHJ17_02445 [Thermomonospora sp.]|nr:hypothetical protein [Thermomonospora sp.]